MLSEKPKGGTVTTNLQVLAQAPLLPEVLDVYDRLVASVGASAFDKVAATAIRDVIAVDRLYLFDIQGPCTSRVFYAEYETAGPPTAEDLYLRQYLPVDPILQATRIADNRNMVMLRTEPQDIAHPRYKRALQAAEIVERVSIVRRGVKHCVCLNVARRTRLGKFKRYELSRLFNLAWFMLPLVARHATLRLKDADCKLTVAELEDRFHDLGAGLPQREMEVCARAVYGMTVEGAALDLNIGRASVLTYRKRAYARLGATCANELCKIVLK